MCVCVCVCVCVAVHFHGLMPLLSKYPRRFLLEDDPPFNHVTVGEAAETACTCSRMFAIPWGNCVLDSLKNIMFLDLCVRETDWRSRARGAKVT